jgi:acetyl/propionyl-CoA carboxylase alpha subunit/acetyl-CoA carboxylase carboxyltransferase component
MTLNKLLIANRGEVAIRVARAAAERGLASVALYSTDDADALHVRRADAAIALPAAGARAYLDSDAVVGAALATGCDALHPGWGFLAESAELARRCASAGIRFVGPSVPTLELLGDKLAARALARRCGVPLIEGSDGSPVTPDGARAFFAALGAGSAMIVKAVAGGGGRGMRIVRQAAEIDEACARCASEAQAAFGSPALYVERLIEDARHVEIQIVGDAAGAVSHLWERECSLQRRHQKLVEIAPSPWLAEALRGQIVEAALTLARVARCESLATFEFLVDGASGRFFFIEANARLQVEHTVTEAVLGVDLVQAQLAIAGGATLAELGLDQPNINRPRGYAMQLRVNAETLAADGGAQPGTGVLRGFAPPSGPGVRVDTHGCSGWRVGTAFDSLLAKLIVHAPSPRFADLLPRARRALREFEIDGVATNLGFLEALLAHPEFAAPPGPNTRFIDTHLTALCAAAPAPRLHAPEPGAAVVAEPAPGRSAPPGTTALAAPLAGTLVALLAKVGQSVRSGETLAVLESMKMEHLVPAQQGGIVRALAAAPGDTLPAGAAILYIEPGDALHAEQAPDAQATDPDHIRSDLAEALARHARTLDAARRDAVARRRATGQRTARENLADLLDPGSFTEFGALAIAGQKRRRSLDDLITNTPADGVVAGIGSVNAAEFGPERARCLAVAYDYTVLAGTQGVMNHKKQDRLFALAERLRLPVVLYAEGGGGRPGDTDTSGLTGLDGPTFAQFARLSGLVPLIGVVSGFCFAGNAALLGCCDLIIATKNASIGMGGPAMIEGGGLGVVAPEAVGPTAMQAGNGVVDLLVDDEAAATDAARCYLSYFQGRRARWTAADARLLRQAIPENRRRVYDIRAVIALVADADSVLELRRDFGAGMVTAFIRVEGRPLGLIANDPRHLGGAIDAAAADKAARFMQLCDAFDLPIVSLCDTPGFMVGPAAEATALVRHTSRMFVVGASLTVPVVTIVLRKAYGLGAQAMSAGSLHASVFTAAWPTGEFGGMGLEGYVRLGFRKELQAIADPAERERWYEAKVASLYEQGKALSIASALEIDAVIDPADTRRWIVGGLDAVPAMAPRIGRKRPCVDAW